MASSTPPKPLVGQTWPLRKPLGETASSHSSTGVQTGEGASSAAITRSMDFFWEEAEAFEDEDSVCSLESRSMASVSHSMSVRSVQSDVAHLRPIVRNNIQRGATQSKAEQMRLYTRSLDSLPRPPGLE